MLPKPSLGDGHAGKHDGDGDGRDQVGHDQDPVLGHLGVGDAFHAAGNGVEEDDGHADQHAGVDFHLHEAGEDDAHAAHLAGHVSEGDEDGADDGRHPGAVGVIALAHEHGHGVLAVFSQVRGQEHGQQHIAAGPAHEVHGPVTAEKGDQTGHGDEGGGRHPVRPGGHAVHDRRDRPFGHVKVAGGFGLGKPGNGYIEGKREPDYDPGPR